MSILGLVEVISYIPIIIPGSADVGSTDPHNLTIELWPGIDRRHCTRKNQALEMMHGGVVSSRWGQFSD